MLKCIFEMLDWAKIYYYIRVEDFVSPACFIELLTDEVIHEACEMTNNVVESPLLC